MKKQLIIAILCFGIILCGGLFGQEARAAVYYVTTTIDRDGTCAPGDCSLREAVKAANATGENDSVFFDSPMQGQTFVLTLGREIKIDTINSGTLVISGEFGRKTRIQGSGSRIFYVANPSPGLELNNLVLTGGNGGGTRNGFGGAIHAYNAPLTLNYVDLIGNAAQTQGGGVSVQSASATIVQSASTTITNSRIHSNAAPEGGGVHLFYATAYIGNSSVINNDGGNAGGGIYVEDGQSTFVNLTVSGNRTTTGGPYPQRGGGAGIYYVKVNIFGGYAVILRYVTITNNIAAIGSGGTGCHYGTFSVSSSIIYNNQGSIGDSCFFTPSNSIVGSPDPLLGALVDDGKTPAYYPLTVGSPAIDGGGSTDVPPIDIRGIGRPSDGDGNGSYTSDIGAYEFPSLVKNTAIGLAGSLAYQIQQAPPNGEITFDPVFFSQPRTITSPYGAYIIASRKLTIFGPGAGLLTLDGQNADRLFYIRDGATLNLKGVRLWRGRSTDFYANHNGGAVHVESGNTFNAENITVEASKAFDNGGAIYVGGTLNAGNIRVENNRTDNNGGGISGNGTINLSNSVVNLNSSGSEGGGIRVQSGSNATITDSTVSNNSIDSASGGGIANYQGNLTVIRSTLSGNTAPNGGGVFAAGSTTINNSTISSNTANSGVGGAVYVFPDSQLATTNTTITNNRAATGGGINIIGNGVYLLRNTIIAANTATSSCPDVNGAMGSFGYNLIGSTTCNTFYQPSGGTTTGNIINPAGGARLAPLGNYGGATLTHALLSDSLAINAGSDSFTTDQRGSQRKIGAAVDIGAFERNIAFDQSPTLPNGSTGINYNQQLSATRMVIFTRSPFNNESANLAPTAFEIVPVAGQSLPPGITLSSGGLLSGMPTMTGTYTFTVKATDTDGIAGVQQFTIQVLAPSAATVTISGRVSTSGGNGLTNATVVLTDASGNSRTARTSGFGYYSFDEVEVGRTYIFTVVSRRYNFVPQIVSVTEERNDLDFTANQ